MPEKLLKLIKGGKSAVRRVGRVKVYVTDYGDLDSLKTDIFVLEEDTNLILTIDKTIQFQEEHPIRLMTSLMRSKKQQVGSLVVNENKWYAVVIDIDAEPLCRPEWVAAAYVNIRERLNQERITRAGICLLGGIYGDIPTSLAFGLFLDFLRTGNFSHLRELSLLVTEEQVQSAKAYLNTSTR